MRLAWLLTPALIALSDARAADTDVSATAAGVSDGATHAYASAGRGSSSSSSSNTKCSTWYDMTAHGSSYRSVKDFGAKGDGETDDTSAIQRAISFNVGSVQQKMPSVVYFPSGRYLVSDTLVMYYHTHLVGSLSYNPDCRSKLVLSAGAISFTDSGAAKPMLVTDNGFGRNTSSPWWEDNVVRNYARCWMAVV
eukprot:SAG31_NODE_3405_length_4311_cov_2.512821_1_plen_194_part_00